MNGDCNLKVRPAKWERDPSPGVFRFCGRTTLGLEIMTMKINQSCECRKISRIELGLSANKREMRLTEGQHEMGRFRQTQILRSACEHRCSM